MQKMICYKPSSSLTVIPVAQTNKPERENYKETFNIISFNLLFKYELSKIYQPFNLVGNS